MIPNAIRIIPIGTHVLVGEPGHRIYGIVTARSELGTYTINTDDGIVSADRRDILW